jgi:MinD superfamily P-loop ATPase
VKEIFHLGVFSGKGGVGKTTITASLAVLFAQKGRNIFAVDCDVDAPNLSILFRASDQPVHSFFVKTTEKAKLDVDKCTRCRRCVDEEFCHFDAISWNELEGIPVIDPIACEGCHACEALCKDHAYSVHPINSGTISTLESKYGFPVITGETILGAQTSGKLVTEMKQYVEAEAKKFGKDMIIIDGPPGIGCPVIAAAADLDYVIVVVEPTTAALHDAQRFIEVVKHFNTQYGIILNKADIWEEGANQIRQYAKENHIEILAEIPLDKDWPASVANCLPFVIFRPESHITKIFANLIEKF